MEPITSKSQPSAIQPSALQWVQPNLFRWFLLGTLWAVVFLSISSYKSYALESISTQSSLSFTHLKPEELASIGAVNAVIRDHKGFMWFGGQDGLARYNGYSVEIFQAQPGANNSLSNNYIHDLREDSRGHLWVATRSGIDKFNRDSETFTRYATRPDGSNETVLTIFEHSSGTLWLGTRGNGLMFFDRESGQFMPFVANSDLSNNVIYDITEDSAGDLWIGTERGGLNHLNLKTRQIRHLKNDPSDSNSLSANDVRSIIVDTKDNLWVGTFGGGLNYYDIGKRKFKRFDTRSKPTGLSDSYIRDMHMDRDALLWIVTENGGLNKFDPKSQAFIQYQSERGNSASLGSNSPVSLYEDIIGDLWIGLSPAGVDMLNKSLPRFTRYTYTPNSASSLTHQEVTAVTLDSKNNVWVGTPNGLNRVDRRTKKITQYKPRLNSSDGLAAAKILSLHEDSRGRLWIGTQGAGANRLDVSRGSFTRYPVNPGRNKGISGHNVRVIYEDSQQQIWFGSESGGLTRYDEKSNRYTRYVHIPGNDRSLSANMVNAIHEDSQGRLWVGTADGLSVMERGLGIFRHYRHDPQRPGSLVNNHVTAITEDNRGRLWVGTQGGFSLLNEREESFINFGPKSGMFKGHVSSLITDDRNNIWLGTPEGLVRYNVKEKTYKIFDKRHGFFGNIRSHNASAKSTSGELILGGTEGLSIFDPITVENNLMIPQVAITDFAIFDQSAQIGVEGSPLQKVIGQTNTITLSPDQSTFSFTFSVLNYRSPEDNKYSYMLEGFDDNWTEVSRERSASYANLEPGTYTFRVFGYNNEGVRSAGSTDIEITIKPKMWQTWSKYAPYVVLALVVACIFFIIGAILRFITRKQAEYKQQLENMVVEKPKALQKKAAKPLIERETAVLKPAKKLEKPAKAKHDKPDAGVGKLSKKPVDVKKQADKKSTKEESVGPLKDKIKPVDIHSVVTAVLMRSKVLLDKKELKVVNQVSKSLQPSTLNEERLEKALYNLVANSIRISDRGKISVSAEQKGSYLLFKVTNSDGRASNKSSNKLFDTSTEGSKKNGSSFVFTLPFPLDHDKDIPAIDMSPEVVSVENKEERKQKSKKKSQLRKATRKRPSVIPDPQRSTEKSENAPVEARRTNKRADEILTLDTLEAGVKELSEEKKFASSKKDRNFSGRKKAPIASTKPIGESEKLSQKVNDKHINDKKAKQESVEKSKAVSHTANSTSKPKRAHQDVDQATRQPAKKAEKQPLVKNPTLVKKEITMPDWDVPELEIPEDYYHDGKGIEDADSIKSIMINIDVKDEDGKNPRDKFKDAIEQRAKKHSSVDRKRFIERVLGDSMDSKQEFTEVDDSMDMDLDKAPEIFVDFTEGTDLDIDVDLTAPDMNDADEYEDDHIDKVVADCHIKLIKSNADRDESYRHHILIVDENPVKRMILQNYLSSENYRVSQLESGADALAMIGRVDGIDLVILGETLQDMQGHQVCEELRTSFTSQDLPVIFASDTTGEQDFELCYKVGGNDVITKDESKENFISRIKKQISILEYGRSKDREKKADDSSLQSINKVS